MSRYKAMVVLTDEDGMQQIAGADTVFEPSDDMPVRTGLLDLNGTPLYRLPDRRPIGFNLTKARA